jgi:cold shock CspA family protein
VSETLPTTHASAPSIRMTGAIRKLSKDGYGFIAADDGQDYFFHWSACDVNSKDFRALLIRERVSFVLTSSPKGPRAIEIRTIGGDNGTSAS